MSKTEWKEYRLGEIYEVHNGLSKGREFFGSGYPFISFSTVFNKWFIPEIITDFAQTTESEQESYSIKAGDILVTRTSETADELGMSCVALRDIPNATYNGFCKRMRQYNKDVDVDSKYVGYYMRNPEFRKKFQAFAGSMSTRASLTNDALLGLTIKLPPLAEQQRIAKILSSLDDKIELNNAINRNLEEQAQAIFKSWFIDFEPFGGKMPEDWINGKLSDLETVVGGGTPSKAKNEYYTRNGIAWITPKDLSLHPNKFTSKGEIDITKEGYANSSAKIMPEGTILFSSRAPIGYITIAKNEVCTNQGFKSVIPKANVGTAYVYFYLKTHTEEIENKASGSTFKETSGSLMNSLDAIIPSDKILSDFNKICNPTFNQQKALENENQYLISCRDMLLPKLMSGEMELSC